MKRILFQGDSITDAGRARDNDINLGVGYPYLVEATLKFENPNEYAVFNRGVSGNRIVDLYARIKSDFINLAPDYASILIGINDVWHELHKNGVDAEKFEKIYTMLVEEILQALPNLKLVLMGAFVLPGEATVGDTLPAHLTGYETKYDYLFKETAVRAEITRRIAEKFGLPFIDLQKAFDEAVSKNGAATYSIDGVHPEAAGRELIKREWLKVFHEAKL